MESRELFERAIEVVLEHEGGYVDHPNDPGGATNFGISSTHNPDVDVEHLTREVAIELYWERYWEGVGFHRLPERVAIKSFDLAVNMGDHGAIACLQRAIRACGTSVAVDGVIGPETAGAAIICCETCLVAAIRSEAAGEYRMKLARDSSLAPFCATWIARAYS